jgi:predicted DNA-binding protein
MSRTYSAKDFVWLVLKKKKKPYILVEGKDDIAFYENIIESISKDYVVKPIGRYKNSSNCTAVIEFMQELDEVLNRDEHRKYFLGIIDGDARKHRGTLPKENSLLYILQYYSWESYFIGREVVEKSIKNFLKTRSLLTDEVIEIVYNEHIEKYLLDELWLCALKRLKDGDSDEKCNQDDSINRLDRDSQFIKQLKELEDDLSQFAIENQLICNHETLLEITKGKWGLNFFIKKYLQVLKKLPSLCTNGIISTCDYCEENDIQNCLYELKAHYKEEHIQADMINLTNLSSLTPIKERLKQLK